MDFTDKVIACVVTGNGLKDSDIVLKQKPEFIEASPDMAEIEKALGWM